MEPGDIVCTRNPKGFTARMIRLGAALLDRPNTVNHVIVVSHRDPAGTLWGIEGRPGGVGYVDMKNAVRSPYTLNNGKQAKTEEQRQMVVHVAKGLIGTPYDWQGIIADGMKAIHAQELWCSSWKGQVPAQVVCSSLADWVYDKVGLESPGAVFDRTVTPGDWADLITVRRWNL